jgi:hypothetical protein
LDGHVVVGVELLEGAAVVKEVIKVAASAVVGHLSWGLLVALVQFYAVGAAAHGAQVASARHLALVEVCVEAGDVENITAPALAA